MRGTDGPLQATVLFTKPDWTFGRPSAVGRVCSLAAAFGGGAARCFDLPIEPSPPGLTHGGIAAAMPLLGAGAPTVTDVWAGPGLYVAGPDRIRRLSGWYATTRTRDGAIAVLENRADGSSLLRWADGRTLPEVVAPPEAQLVGDWLVWQSEEESGSRYLASRIGGDGELSAPVALGVAAAPRAYTYGVGARGCAAAGITAAHLGGSPDVLAVEAGGRWRVRRATLPVGAKLERIDCERGEATFTWIREFHDLNVIRCMGGLREPEAWDVWQVRCTRDACTPAKVRANFLGRRWGEWEIASVGRDTFVVKANGSGMSIRRAPLAELGDAPWDELARGGAGEEVVLEGVFVRDGVVIVLVYTRSSEGAWATRTWRAFRIDAAGHATPVRAILEPVTLGSHGEPAP